VLGADQLAQVGHQKIVYPPSTTSHWPVWNTNSGLARNTAIGPRSSGVPHRRTGVRVVVLFMNFSLSLPMAFMSVSIQPGRIELTRILWRASSTARPRVSAVNAPLLAP